MLATAATLAAPLSLSAQMTPQRTSVNDDETRVAPYTLPDPLVRENGTRVRTPDEWFRERRPELFAVFEREVYGRSPERPAGMRFDTRSVDADALGGRATRKEVRIHLMAGQEEPFIDVLLYIPNGRRGPVPIFLALTYGNHTITSDPGVSISPHFLRDRPRPDTARGPAPRGREASRWPIDTILARGYGLAAVYLGDLDPDAKDRVSNGVRPFFYKAGQTGPQSDEWAALATWGWGLSRALDYLERDPDVDARRVALMGHSRTGKASLWAGARDTRFAMVIANESGTGGAKLSRRNFGETVAVINNGFPYWFARNFRKYDGRESELPVDQHELIALLAPRPVYIAAAAADLWADPKGMFLAGKGAEPVYRLLGAPVALPASMPEIDRPALEGRIGFHIRPGIHDVTLYDWQQFLAFADLHLRGR
ncbi:MAG: acetylxylan esterase [Gemmatimonadaceae bacterium]